MPQARLSVIGLVFCVLVVGCVPSGDNPEPKRTKGADELREGPNREFSPSIVELLAQPVRYHGKRVRVKGFLHVRFEGTAIYLSREDAEHLITRNGFWVTFDPKATRFEDGDEPKQLDAKYVLIEGTFDKNGFGHLGGWAGAIKNVDRAYKLERRP